MAEYDDLPYIVIERRSGGASPFLWGALLGAGIALLLAPRSGEETQRELRKGVRRLRGAAEDRVSNARERVTGAVDRARQTVTDRVDSVRDTIEMQAERARMAVDAGRQAARDARSDLERRVADAKDAFATVDGLGGPASRPRRPSDVDVDIVVTEVVVEEERGPEIL